MTPDTAAEIITLRGGLQVSVIAIKLALQLEELGIEMRIDGEDLVLRPARLVPPTDIPRLRQHRDEIKALVRYCEGRPE